MAELIEYDAVDFVDFFWVVARIHNLNIMSSQKSFHEIFGHCEFDAEKQNALGADFPQLFGDTITNMDESGINTAIVMTPPLNTTLDSRSDFVHGVCSDCYIITAKNARELFSFARERLFDEIPVYVIHQIVISSEVYTPEYEVGGSESTGAFINLAVNLFIVVES